MNASVSFRIAWKPDLPDVRWLSSQPDLDDGQMLSLSDAHVISDRKANYSNYKLDIAVGPEYHGRGLGKEMMRHAIRIAAHNGCYKTMLSSGLTGKLGT